jgi:type I restriction enzyme M protein
VDYAQHNQIVNFIWGIADDVLRDLYVRGKYRDVILPMTVLRRLDAVLEPTKQAVLDMKASLDEARIVHQDQALRQAAGQAFYNTSRFTLRDLRARASQQQLKADFEAYLDGFSPNVQDILESFEFRHQIPRLSKADAIGTLIEKFLSPAINLGPSPVLNGDGSVKHPGLDNHGMGTVFEELVRRFNEENNEEAGEHWTPRDAVKLMARLIFLPVADEIESGTYLLYDGALGTGGMLTVAEETLQQLAEERGKQVATHLFGQEINAETYAICTADLLLKGEGDAADNIVGGPEHSTLANDAFPSREFDFMLSNPPYGKSWKSDLERMGGKGGIKDPRFVVEHAGDPEYSLITRSSDGQMMFLANMLSKMKHGTTLGSRVAEVHNGSSLFTGDAGQGESNIRRWIIENDWLEAIVALPLNMFYNTGSRPTSGCSPTASRRTARASVQLIDATQWFKPLRKNLGKKNCELAESDIQRICDTFLAFEETETVEDLPQCRLRLLEGHGRAAAAPQRRRPRARVQGRRDQASEGRPRPHRRCATGDQEDPQEGNGRRPAAGPVRGHHRRQARCGRVRARLGPARHRAGAAAGGRRHRGLPAPRGAAPRPGRLVRREQRQDRLRDQLHPLLLQAPADANTGGDSCRHPRAREGD